MTKYKLVITQDGTKITKHFMATEMDHGIPESLWIFCESMVKPETEVELHIVRMD